MVFLLAAGGAAHCGKHVDGADAVKPWLLRHSTE